MLYNNIFYIIIVATLITLNFEIYYILKKFNYLTMQKNIFIILWIWMKELQIEQIS